MHVDSENLRSNTELWDPRYLSVLPAAVPHPCTAPKQKRDMHHFACGRLGHSG